MAQNEYTRGMRLARDCAYHVMKLRGITNATFELVSSDHTSDQPKEKTESIVTSHIFTFVFLPGESTKLERKVTVKFHMTCRKSAALSEANDGADHEGQGYWYGWKLNKVELNDPGVPELVKPCSKEIAVCTFVQARLVPRNAAHLE
jgi:hypothetical protein